MSFAISAAVRKCTSSIALLSILAACAGTAFATVVPVVNASFEDPDVVDDGWAPAPAPWIDTAGSGFVIHDPNGGRFTGAGGDDVQGVLPLGGQIYNLSAATLSQVIGATQANTQYTLTFFQGSALDFAAVTATATLEDNNVSFGSTGVLAAPPVGQFYKRTLVASTGATVSGNLDINFTAPGGGSAWLDWVQLYSNPAGTPIAIANPSFEDDAVTDGNWSGTVAGWTVTGSGGFVAHDPDGNRFLGASGDSANANGILPDGGQVLNLDATSVSQTVGATLANTQYTLTFWSGTALDFAGSAFTAELYDGASLLGILSSSTPAVAGAWEHHSLTLTTGGAVSGNLSIVFTNTGAGASWIDQVQLNFVTIPEPSSPVILAFSGVFLWLSKGRRCR